MKAKSRPLGGHLELSGSPGAQKADSPTTDPDLPETGLLDIDPKSIPSVALRWLVDEVRNDPKPHQPATYNRIYHRHNR